MYIVHVCICVYIYIYTYTYPRRLIACLDRGVAGGPREAPQGPRGGAQGQPFFLPRHIHMLIMNKF